MNDLDIMWRSFFVGEKHQILSQMFVKFLMIFKKIIGSENCIR